MIKFIAKIFNSTDWRSVGFIVLINALSLKFTGSVIQSMVICFVAMIFGFCEYRNGMKHHARLQKILEQDN